MTNTPMTDTPKPRSNAISPVVFMGSGGPDLTTPEQVEKSVGMCRLHGLHNTEATLRALSAKLAEAERRNLNLRQIERNVQAERERQFKRAEAAEAERDALRAEILDKEASADYWHQESRIQFEAKNKAKAERDAALGVLQEIESRPDKMIWGEDHEVNEAMRDMEEMAHAFLAARKKGGE